MADPPPPVLPRLNLDSRGRAILGPGPAPTCYESMTATAHVYYGTWSWRRSTRAPRLLSLLRKRKRRLLVRGSSFPCRIPERRATLALDVGTRVR